MTTRTTAGQTRRVWLKVWEGEGMRYILSMMACIYSIAGLGLQLGYFNQNYSAERQLFWWFLWASMALIYVYPNVEKEKRDKIKRINYS